MFMGWMLGPLAICLFMVFYGWFLFFLHVDGSYEYEYDVLISTCLLCGYVLEGGWVCSCGDFTCVLTFIHGRDANRACH